MSLLPCGGTQLWIRRHVPPKRCYFFSLAFTERPPFLPTFTQWPLIFNKLLVTERPWHIFVTQRRLIFFLIVKQVTIFGKKLDFSKISTNLTKCWEILGHFGPEAPIFWCISLKDPLFLCALSLKDPLFWYNLSPKDPYIWGAWWHSYVTFIRECPRALLQYAPCIVKMHLSTDGLPVLYHRTKTHNPHTLFWSI